MESKKTLAIVDKTNLNQVQVNKTNVKKPNSSVFKISIIFLVLILIILVIGVIFLVNENNNLQDEFNLFKTNSNLEISNLTNSINILNNENNSLKSNLFNLGNDFNELKNSNDYLNQEYVVLKNEANQTIQKINNYEKELQDSMDWFGANATLSEKQKNLLLQLKSNCRTKTSKSCEINLGCIFLINSEFQNYKYIDDEVTSNEIDKLQSIEEFVSNKGGDCEDYSLFFKAEFNSLVNECRDNNLEIKLIAWEDFKTTSKLWLNNSKTWYFDNAKVVDIENSFANIVCGNMYDPNSERVNGHCVIAFTKNKINSILDLGLLNEAVLVEPQSGKYLGVVNTTSNIFLVTNNYFLNNSYINTSYINTIITDNDFFLFSEVENVWQSYGGFAKELQEKQVLLKNLILGTN
jgi:hypothetical protein